MPKKVNSKWATSVTQRREDSAWIPLPYSWTYMNCHFSKQRIPRKWAKAGRINSLCWVPFPKGPQCTHNIPLTKVLSHSLIQPLQRGKELLWLAWINRHSTLGVPNKEKNGNSTDKEGWQLWNRFRRVPDSVSQMPNSLHHIQAPTHLFSPSTPFLQKPYSFFLQLYLLFPE